MSRSAPIRAVCQVIATTAIIAFGFESGSNNDDCAKFYAFDGPEHATLCGSDGQNARSNEQKTEVDPQYATRAIGLTERRKDMGC